MHKKILFCLMVVTFSNFQLISFAENPPATPPAQEALLQNLPPIILIAGKERESFQKVFIDKAKVGDEINVKLLMFDREPTEEIKTNTYGLPDSAKLDVKKDPKGKNRAEGNLSWKLTESDKGFHTIIIEVSNSKSASSRISLSYDVK